MSQEITTDDLWTEYGKLGFNCVDCDNRVYLFPDHAECHSCGRLYEVTVGVEIGEKREKHDWASREST